MKNLIVATGLALGLAAVAFAQAPADPARAEMHAQKRVDHLAEKLNLTEAQKLQVQAIFEEQGAARREMFERHRSEREALHEQGDAKLDQVLTAEQQAQFDQLRAERKERWQEKRGERRHRGMHGE